MNSERKKKEGKLPTILSFFKLRVRLKLNQISVIRLTKHLKKLERELKLTKKDFSRIIFDLSKELKESRSTQQLINQLFCLLDLDDDGLLSFSEFA